MLIDRPVQVSPLAGHLDVGLIDEPPVTGSVAARPGSLDELEGETLDPPVDGDVVDGDAALVEAGASQGPVPRCPVAASPLQAGGRFAPSQVNSRGNVPPERSGLQTVSGEEFPW